MSRSSLPIAVIGAGPVGLAAAAHLAARGEPFVHFEAGSTVGASVLRWGHVRMFSPWKYNVDDVARQLLEEHGWRFPRVLIRATASSELVDSGLGPDAYPTGRDLVEQYLQPLANLPQIRPHLHLGARVVSVTRQGFDKMKTPGREDAPFVLRIEGADGMQTDVLARAVIDASGTYRTPNPLGADGLPVPGEAAVADHVAYGNPDVLGKERHRYAGRRVLVVGSGHSAFNTLLDLATLAADAPGTRTLWALRRPRLGGLFGGGARDKLPVRGALGARIRELLADGRIELFTGVRPQRVTAAAQGIVVEEQWRHLPPVDEIVVATGFRPDLSSLRELRVSVDPTVESPMALAPLIDPNLHSCGTVPPHGVDELAHPERDIYIVGMKSYGRAPSFLTLTGYEQVRSIVAALAGEWASARNVELILPETGVCSLNRSEAMPPATGASTEAVCCAAA